MLTKFQNSVNELLCSKFVCNNVTTIPLHFKCVTTLNNLVKHLASLLTNSWQSPALCVSCTSCSPMHGTVVQHLTNSSLLVRQQRLDCDHGVFLGRQLHIQKSTNLVVRHRPITITSRRLLIIADHIQMVGSAYRMGSVHVCLCVGGGGIQ